MKFFFKKCKESGFKIQFNSVRGPPLSLDGTSRSISELKLKQECDKVDNEGREVNSLALLSIFKGVSFEEFCRIATCKLAKEA